MRQNPTHKSMRQIGILIIKEIYLIVITSNQFELNFVWLIFDNRLYSIFDIKHY